MFIVFLSLSIVGALGRGPKYLSDEYAVMDTRYWPTDEPAVTWISYMELVIYIPLCYAWYVEILQCMNAASLKVSHFLYIFF